MTNYNQPECFISTKHSYATLICLWHWLPDSSFLCFVNLYYAHCCGIRTYSQLLYLFGALSWSSGYTRRLMLWGVVNYNPNIISFKTLLVEKNVLMFEENKTEAGCSLLLQRHGQRFRAPSFGHFKRPKKLKKCSKFDRGEELLPCPRHTCSLSLSLSLSHPRHITQANTQAKLYCHLLLTTYLPIAYQMEMVE